MNVIQWLFGRRVPRTPEVPPLGPATVLLAVPNDQPFRREVSTRVERIREELDAIEAALAAREAHRD